MVRASGNDEREDHRSGELMALARFEKMSRWKRNVISLGAVVLVTLAFLPFNDWMNQTEVSLALLLVVLFASTLFGSTSGLLASALGILCFNFFFLPPFNTLNISGADNIVTFAAFVITALIAGQLSGYARRRAEESEARKIEIERLYEELTAAFEQASEAEALRRSEKLKSALLDAVTHDLRTPLTSIKASATTLIEDANEPMLDHDSRREFLNIIDEETDRLNDFIEGMVGIAKIEAGALQLRQRSASVEEIVSNAVDRLANSLGSRSLETHIASDLPNVFADAASISEVVYTLVDNAVKYSADGTRIRVSAQEKGAGTLVISVEDQGRGISQEVREKVFDKFFRVDDTDIHRTDSGLGLGLAIAKGIVESQGGSIAIEDAGDEFVTRFTVSLRVEEDELDDR